MVNEYALFISQIKNKLGIDLAQYKETQMKRRLTSLRNKRGYNNFSAYFKALENNNDLLEEFIDRITINVSEFYRNPKRWHVLKEKVIPELTKNRKSISIWSAACSTGEEPYSLAIMLNEHFPHIQASILATDIDMGALSEAKEGIYQEQALKELSLVKKNKYFTVENNRYKIDEKLKRNITFRKHDLLNDSYPKNIDLIVCRNVLIYFTDQAKENIYHKFSDSLVKSGILFIGSTEQIFNAKKYNLSLYDTFFYQKL